MTDLPRLRPLRAVPAALLLFFSLLPLPRAAMSQTGPESSGSAITAGQQERPRARALGLEVGVFGTGEHNAITDVEGVLVGQVTRIEGDRIRTGITAIRPHPGNVFREKVPAAIHVANGFGKLLGVTQVRELGELETPILLTCTLCVWKAADALVGWMLERPEMERVRSINPVVGETNDGGLNDIRTRPVEAAHVRQALESASGGPVEEGSVGAGTGTRAFGWKGGIGTSSRVLPDSRGAYTVGVLVQSNFGGILTMNGAPVGKELGRYPFRSEVEGDDGGRRSSTTGQDAPPIDVDAGSIMIVVATDAPLSERNLERLAKRAVLGLARTGAIVSNGSGDYVVAFSTAEAVRRRPDARVRPTQELANARMSALFQAVAEATEEAIYNSLLRATTVTGVDGNTAEALPLDETLEVLRRHGALSGGPER